MSKQIEIKGRRVSYQESEGSGRPVLFIHGNSASADTWAAQLDGPIGQRYRCVALDLPGHGDSEAPVDPNDWSLPGYAEVVRSVAEATDTTDAVLVGWSLGGHIALEAVPQFPELAGVAIFGTPPMGMPPAMEQAFLPSPAMGATFTPELDHELERLFVEGMVAAGSDLDLDEFIVDIRRSNGGARAGLGASMLEGRFLDELEVINGLAVPFAIIHGAEEQLVSGDYLDSLTPPSLWRGAVQRVSGSGHSPHRETVDQFNALLGEFLADC